MSRRSVRSGPFTLLVIGVHREERAFGEAVAAGLDVRRYEVLRILQGLSGEHPRADQLQRARRNHQALYRQILERVTPEHRLLVDLHTGIDDQAPRADLLCGDAVMLERLSAIARALDPDPSGPPRIRCIRLVEDTGFDEIAPGASRYLVARGLLPPAVWRRTVPVYIGLEVYLSQPGAGTAHEHRFARLLLEHIRALAEDGQAQPG